MSAGPVTYWNEERGQVGPVRRSFRPRWSDPRAAGRVGQFVARVRRWRDGRMLIRWIAAGLQEVRRGFRRLRGHRDLPALIRVLDRTPRARRKEVA